MKSGQRRGGIICPRSPSREAEILNCNLPKPPEICPNCGADVPPNAKACPECGSDEQTGWSEAATAANLGLPDESFDYDKFVAEEFGERAARPHGMSWVWWLVAVLVLALLLAALMSSIVR
jgi:ribosomal protein L40E